MMGQRNEHGVSLIETMIATLVAFIAMSSIGAVVFTAVTTNQSWGVEQSRMTTAAQERMEQLLRLNYSDSATNTTLITDSGWQVGLTSNANTDLGVVTQCPSSSSNPNDMGYTDFLDANGNDLAGTCATVIAQAYFQRRWQITDVSVTDSLGNAVTLPGLTTSKSGVKKITVVVLSPHVAHAGGAVPSVSLTTYKTAICTLVSQAQSCM